MPKEKVDFDKFLNDPAFEQDRSFLDKYLTHFLEKKAKEAAEKKKAEDNENLTIFDRLFGG